MSFFSSLWTFIGCVIIVTRVYYRCWIRAQKKNWNKQQKNRSVACVRLLFEIQFFSHWTFNWSLSPLEYNTLLHFFGEKKILYFYFEHTKNPPAIKICWKWHETVKLASNARYISLNIVGNILCLYLQTARFLSCAFDVFWLCQQVLMLRCGKKERNKWRFERRSFSIDIPLFFLKHFHNWNLVKLLKLCIILPLI